MLAFVLVTLVSFCIGKILHSSEHIFFFDFKLVSALNAAIGTQRNSTIFKQCVRKFTVRLWFGKRYSLYGLRNYAEKEPDPKEKFGKKTITHK